MTLSDLDDYAIDELEALERNCAETARRAAAEFGMSSDIAIEALDQHTAVERAIQRGHGF